MQHDELLWREEDCHAAILVSALPVDYGRRSGRVFLDDLAGRSLLLQGGGHKRRGAPPRLYKKPRASKDAIQRGSRPSDRIHPAGNRPPTLRTGAHRNWLLATS